MSEWSSQVPFGSSNEAYRIKAKELMVKAIRLAQRLSIKIIQVAGYDVYYEKKTRLSRKLFIEGLEESVKIASEYGIILSI